MSRSEEGSYTTARSPFPVGLSTGPGQRVGHYELIEELGRGSMGVVFRARAEGREVALKLILPGYLKTAPDADEVLSRFGREARIACAIDHPNVVRTHGHGVLDGMLYMECEIVPGGSLQSRLEAGALEVAEAAELVRGVLRALAALHERETIHRDVKPSNILLDADGRPKLSDLGLARSTRPDRTELTVNGIYGTPRYMAPEQAYAATDVDIRCDLYAVGAVLFHCLAGRPPFQAARVTDLFQKHRSAPCPRLPHGPAALSRLIARFMAKSPDDRPATPAQALAELEEALAGGCAEDPVADAAATTGGPVLQALDVGARNETWLARARLVVRDRGTVQTLFVYAGKRLRLGRAGLDKGLGNDVCLRHRPAVRDDLVMKISGNHFDVTSAETGQCEIQDLLSDHGTELDGRPLTGGKPARIGQVAEVLVAGTLPVTVQPCPAEGACPTIAGEGPAPDEGGVLVERPTNGRDHAYLLVTGHISLGLLCGSLRPLRGPLELLSVGDCLWRTGADLPAGRCAPLRVGDSFPVGAARVEVHPIRPEDQK